MSRGERILRDEQISREIRRFEEVHPYIYRLYELIESVPQESRLQDNIRQLVVNLEDAFVNSQEWTMGRAVSDIRLGIVGCVDSGRVPIIHRYLTGYDKQPEPEEDALGGRFKKQVLIEDRPYLLLIRDEGDQMPCQQFAHWADAVLFMFAADDVHSFKFAQDCLTALLRYRQDLPLFVVATQMEPSRVPIISEDEMRQVWRAPQSRLYVVPVSSGAAIERLFHDACCRVLSIRLRGSGVNGSGTSLIARTPTPTGANFYQEGGGRYGTAAASSSLPYHHHNHHFGTVAQQSQQQQQPQQHYHQRSISAVAADPMGLRKPPPPPVPPIYARAAIIEQQQQQQQQLEAASRGVRALSFVAPPPPPIVTPNMMGGGNVVGAPSSSSFRASHDFGAPPHRHSPNAAASRINGIAARSSTTLLDVTSGGGGGVATGMQLQGPPRASTQHLFDAALQSQVSPFAPDHLSPPLVLPLQLPVSASTSHLPTPSSTPTTQRKHRRISNIFQRPKDPVSIEDRTMRVSHDVNMGQGRAIPIKQGVLYKRSSKGLQREWKKKYVCVLPDGRLLYYPSIKDYMENANTPKQLQLALCAVKRLGQSRPRAGEMPVERNLIATNGVATTSSAATSATVIAASPGAGECTSGGASDDASTTTTLAAQHQLQQQQQQQGTPFQNPGSAAAPKKKRNHRRLGSGIKQTDDEDECFEVVQNSGKRWEFLAPSAEEREEWVTLIEQQIASALTAGQSTRETTNSARSSGLRTELQALAKLNGNGECADCGRPSPDWASLNLGVLICIQCSGVHRQLGSHVSRVRSLTLDDWPREHLVVMSAIGGNTIVNAAWEANAPLDRKPSPDGTREQKEWWIRSKWEKRSWLRSTDGENLASAIRTAVLRDDVARLAVLLAQATTAEVNAPLEGGDGRTALHLAASSGALAALQLLVWYAADIERTDGQGHTALWYAQHGGLQDCVQLLLFAGASNHTSVAAPLAVSDSATTSSSASVAMANVILNAEIAQAQRDLQEKLIFGSTAARSRRGQPPAMDLHPDLITTLSSEKAASSYDLLGTPSTGVVP